MHTAASSNANWYEVSATARPRRAALQGATDTDVCVIGGGITGCSAALHLAERGYRVQVIEAEQVGFGASGRSGGQMIAGYNRDQDTIAGLVGKADAERLWQLNEQALNLTASLIERHKIACDFTRGHIHVGCKPRHARDLEHEAEAWTRLGRQGIEFYDQAATQQRVASPLYTSALYDPMAGHLHPLNYTIGLAAAAEAAGAVIAEKTAMMSWEQQGVDRVKVITNNGEITCRWLVMAGNAHLWRQEREIGRKIMPVGTYIMATAPLGAERAAQIIPGNEAVADINFVLNYFRFSSDHRMLFGGRVSYSGLDPANIKAAMRRTMVSVFPQLADVEAEFAWGGHVAITVNRLPHFGRLSPNVYFAHGFSGHGIALTGLAGQLMAEAIAGQAEQFDVFARIPHRTFPGGTWLRTPALVLAMAWHRLRDFL
jgi:gamma-glutamylputrescine oxidase